MRAIRPTFPVLLAAGLTVATVGLLAGPPTASAAVGTPTFTTWVAPSALTDAANAGEPSLGVNGRTGALMFQANSSTYRVMPNAATGTATWTRVTPPTSLFNIDPILATDRTTGRTYAGGLNGECSILGSSDDDGASWGQVGNACTGVLDHETIGSGPWHGAKPLGATSDRAVYYCAQSGLDACATSGTAGLTFGPPTVVTGACSSLHGHVKVSNDGTAYLPNAHCGALAGGAISTDNGASWSSYTVAGSSEPTDGFDPSVATTPDNTLYESWQGADNHPYVALSTTHGSAWTAPVDLGKTMNPPILSSTFQAVTAGDNGRVAVAYLGSTTGGAAFAPGWKGVWNLYVSYSYDAGKTWSTVQASPDPVQRGYICSGGTACNEGRNLLDFMDANVTKDGRVVVGYADGCIAACAAAGGTEAQSTSSFATIAYQNGGRSLLVSQDSVTATTLLSRAGIRHAAQN